MITTSIVQIDVRMSNPLCEFINDNADAYVIERLPNITASSYGLI